MSMDSMKKYSLAVDENGSPFVLNSKGSIDFGYITEEMNLPPAPIRIAEGNDNYGLAHIEMRHGGQLKDNGFLSAYAFVEYVTTHFETIKQGLGDTYLLEAHNEHNDTLFIKLVRDHGYWKVISGGVFRIQYSRNQKKVYSVPAIRMPEPVSQAKVPAPENNQQASSEASGDSF